MKYICNECQWVYDEAIEGIPFAELAEDWVCPECGAAKDQFSLLEG